MAHSRNAPAIQTQSYSSLARSICTYIHRYIYIYIYPLLSLNICESLERLLMMLLIFQHHFPLSLPLSLSRSPSRSVYFRSLPNPKSRLGQIIIAMARSCLLVQWPTNAYCLLFFYGVKNKNKKQASI